MGLQIYRVTVDKNRVILRVRKDAGIWFCIPVEHFTVDYFGSPADADRIARKAFKQSEAWKSGELCETTVDDIRVVIIPDRYKPQLDPDNEKAPEVEYRGHQYKVYTKPNGNHHVYNVQRKRFVAIHSPAWYAAVKLVYQDKQDPDGLQDPEQSSKTKTAPQTTEQ